MEKSDERVIHDVYGLSSDTSFLPLDGAASAGIGVVLYNLVAVAGCLERSKFKYRTFTKSLQTFRETNLIAKTLKISQQVKIFAKVRRSSCFLNMEGQKVESFRQAQCLIVTALLF